MARRDLVINRRLGLEIDREGERLHEAGLDFRRQHGIQNQELLICCVAGLRPEKLHSVLIKAFRLVLREGIRCRLLLAGEGSMEQSLRQMIEDSNLNSSVTFLGGLSDVRPLLAASDIKVLPSAAETFSMAMLEAMAMGVPVISTEVGGACEAITDGVSGVLVPAGDVDQLALKMGELLTDESLRSKMGASARKTVVEKFREETMVEKSAASLHHLLGEK